MKSEGIINLCEVNFWISKLFIQHTGSCFVYETGGAIIYIICVRVCPVCVCQCVSVCVWYQTRVLVKTMSSFSKNTQQGAAGTLHGTEAWQIKAHNINKQNYTLVVTWSRI